MAGTPSAPNQPGILAQALAQQQAQAASAKKTAASLMAKASHAPKPAASAVVKPNPPAPAAPNPMQAAPAASPSPVAGVAPSLTPQNVAISLAAPQQQAQARITQLQQQLQQAQQQAVAATNQPIPNAPTYTAPTIQKPDVGRTLGDALAALIAPKAASGILGGVQANQKQREDDYTRNSQQAKDQYDAQKDAYGTTLAQRTKSIEAADKNANAIESQLTHAEGAEDRLTQNAIRDQLGAGNLEERKSNDQANQQNRKEQLHVALGHLEIARDTLSERTRNDYAQLGFKNKALAQTHADRVLSLSQSMARLGMSEEKATEIAYIHEAGQAVLQNDRDLQGDKRSLIGIAQSEARNMNNLVIQAAKTTDPVQRKALLDRINAVYGPNGPGQGLMTALRANGIDGEAAVDDLADSASTAGYSPNVDAQGNPVLDSAGNMHTGSMVYPGSQTAPAPDASDTSVMSLMHKMGVPASQMGGVKAEQTHVNNDAHNAFLDSGAKSAKEIYAKAIKQGHTPESAIAGLQQIWNSDPKNPRADFDEVLKRAGIKKPEARQAPGRPTTVTGKSPTLQQAGILPTLLP